MSLLPASSYANRALFQWRCHDCPNRRVHAVAVASRTYLKSEHARFRFFLSRFYAILERALYYLRPVLSHSTRRLHLFCISLSDYRVDNLDLRICNAQVESFPCFPREFDDSMFRQKFDVLSHAENTKTCVNHLQDIANITTETAHDLINLPLTILHFISLLIRGFFDGTAKIVIPMILEPVSVICSSHFIYPFLVNFNIGHQFYV